MDIYVFVCDICGRGFKQKSHLNSHKNKKNKCTREELVKIDGITPELIEKYIADFKCAYCKRTFSRRHNVVNHIKYTCKAIIGLSTKEKSRPHPIGGSSHSLVPFDKCLETAFLHKHICKTTIERALSDDYSSFKALVEVLFLNDKYPQYKNIYISGTGEAQIYLESGWSHIDTNSLLTIILVKLCRTIDDISCMRSKYRITQTYRDTMASFILTTRSPESYGHPDPILHDIVKKKIYTALQKNAVNP